MIRPMYMDYDKISDDIMYLGAKLYLRMNVYLSNKYEKDGENYRIPFHKEYRYDSKYASNKLVTIRRSFDYFISLDKTDSEMSSVIFKNQDMILLRTKLGQVSQWFTDGTFAVKNKQLIVYKKKNPILMEGLTFGKYIQFDPVVLVWEQTGTQEQGVRITLSDPSIYADISIDKFYGLLYCIQSMNLYQSAQILLNYIQRPDFGTNMMEFEHNEFLDNKERDMKGVSRVIPATQKKRSFFDKLDEL